MQVFQISNLRFNDRCQCSKLATGNHKVKFLEASPTGNPTGEVLDASVPN
jgi:hypothetical protein